MLMISRKRLGFYKVGWSALALVLLFGFVCFPGEARDEPPETLIVTEVRGDVTYVRSSESPAPQAVIPFLKLQPDDVLTLPAESELSVLFIQRGIGETWQGPEVLRYQDGRLLVQEGGGWQKERPAVLRSLLFEPQKFLADSPLLNVPDQIRATPRIIPVVREIPKDQMVSVDKTFAILQKEFGEDDATPAMYLLSVYEEYGQYDRMSDVLNTLLEEHPENPVLLAWQRWVNSRK